MTKVTLLTGSEIQSIIIKAETYQHPGRHVQEELSSTSSSKGRQEKTDFQAVWRRVLKPTTTVTHLFQQEYTYSKKATPPNSATPWAKHIQTIKVLRKRNKPDF